MGNYELDRYDRSNLVVCSECKHATAGDIFGLFCCHRISAHRLKNVPHDWFCADGEKAPEVTEIASEVQS